MKRGDKFVNKFIVSRKIYEKFKALSSDNNPLHTNSGFAQKYGFVDKVMYGNILGGFVSYFVGEMLPIKNVAILSQELNFLNPVYLNDKLDFEATVEYVHKSVSVCDFKLSFKKEGDKKIASGKVRIKVLG